MPQPKKLPYFKFYPGDWRKDPNLTRCSHAAKGVLMDALCLAFETEERGVFITGGRPWPEKEIAEAVGGNTDVTVRSLSELLLKGVLKRRESDGAIYSAKMVRDEEIRLKRATGGHFGGNPQLAKVNLTGNLQPNLKLEYESDTDSSQERKGECEGKTEDDVGLNVPQGLRTKRFVIEWNKWVDHRTAMGKCKDFVALFQRQLDWLGEFPEPTAVQIIGQSLRQGWQGLFELSGIGKAAAAKNGELSLHDMRVVLQAKETKAAEIKRRFCSEVAAGDAWSDPSKRSEYFKIRREIKELNNKISNLA